MLQSRVQRLGPSPAPLSAKLPPPHGDASLLSSSAAHAYPLSPPAATEERRLAGRSQWPSVPHPGCSQMTAPLPRTAGHLHSMEASCWPAGIPPSIAASCSAAGWAACTGECTAHAPRSNLLTAHLHTSRHQAKPRLLRVPTCQVLGHLAAALHGGPREATCRRRRQQTPSRYGSCGGILVQLRALAHRPLECLPMVQGRGQGNLPSAGWEASSPTSAWDDSTTAGTTA